MTDNFELIRKYIAKKGLPKKFEQTNDKHFVIELVRRGKDNPDLPAANYHFKNYYIDSLEKFDSVEDEIKELCDVLPLRAYISVNFKSFEHVMKDTMAEMARRISLNDHHRPYAIYESCSGKYKAPGDNTFIVDVDEGMLSVDYYLETIKRCRPYDEMSLEEFDKKYLIVPTRSGNHIVIGGFYEQQFYNFIDIEHGVKMIPEVKKNHLTLLYENVNNH